MKIVIAATTLVVALVACADRNTQTLADAMADDGSITTLVKARLDNDLQVGAMRIDVETINGEVQLAGFAGSEQDKSRAEDIARGVSYVKGVRNDIVVRPPITQ
jgi:hyperosmotically inducible protein